MLLFSDTLLFLIGALVLDAFIGDPDRIWRRIPHPVVFFGKVISIADQDFNSPRTPPNGRAIRGLTFLASLALGAFLLGLLMEAIFRLLPYGEFGTILVAAIFLAQNSLYRHVAAVRAGFLRNGLQGGREAVAMIVGRNTRLLDESGVSRAAIESGAENFSDGVVAPAFWFALLGLPGLLVYKAVNTADSMIGHKTEKHQAFGWASARFDDLINLPASRIAGVLIALSAPICGGSIVHSFKVMMRDSRLHRSPNAGWPEAAMAANLGVALSGPRQYSGYSVDDPWINPDGRREIVIDDISRSLRVMACAWGVFVFLIALAETAFLLA